jgi:hypothetical protein
MPPNELKFWQMVQDLLKLSQAQSEALFERVWVLDLERTDPWILK